MPSVSSLDSWIPNVEGDDAVYVRLVDPEYEQWQNETFVEKFDLLGKSTRKLKKFLDPVLETELVDTSSNPGRSVARTGYVEALGHEMWLMPPFWQVTKAKRDIVKRSFRCRALAGDVLGVTLSESPFDEDNPPSENVRRVLFP